MRGLRNNWSSVRQLNVDSVSEMLGKLPPDHWMLNESNRAAVLAIFTTGGTGRQAAESIEIPYSKLMTAASLCARRFFGYGHGPTGALEKVLVFIETNKVDLHVLNEKPASSTPSRTENIGALREQVRIGHIRLGVAKLGERAKDALIKKYADRDAVGSSRDHELTMTVEQLRSQIALMQQRLSLATLGHRLDAAMLKKYSLEIDKLTASIGLLKKREAERA